MPKFLQRINFNGQMKSRSYAAGPAIIQYHPQATTPEAQRVGYVVAFLEEGFAEHGASLAAGPEALDLLDRIVTAFDRGDLTLGAGAQGLIGAARELLKRATPPEGSVLPNGTPRLT